MPEETEPQFEAALGQLEEIVESLERGEPDLAAALAKYETGVRLLTQCYGLLDRAERSVALLTGVDSEGNPATAHYDTTATIEIEKAAREGSATTSGGDQPQASSILAPKPSRSRRVKPPAEPEPNRFDPPF
jgi:exodeoxyribonuclease VII small subunit